MTIHALRIGGLSKRFGDTYALRQLTLDVRPCEVVGLVGENGAGKSTLLKVIAGVLAPDAGTIILRGTALRRRKHRGAADAGIGMMWQEPALVPGISVAENIFLGREGPAVRFGVYRWRNLNARAARLLIELGVTKSPAALTESLTFSEQQLIAFAKAIAVEGRAGEAPIVLLDEPTSALDERGVTAVLRTIDELRSRASIVFASHRLEEVLRVCDRIYVLKDGECVAECDARRCTVEALQALMLGETVGREFDRVAAPSTAAPTVCLEVRQLRRRDQYVDIDFALHHGEVLGIAGAADSGCAELCRTLFGIDGADGGTMMLDGRAVVLRTPSDAVAQGIGYVPAERASEGIVGSMSVMANMTLAHLGQLCGRFGIDSRRERGVAQRWIERLRIKTPAATTPACELSGGNQQKVVLAKWLAGKRIRVLILDHPFRGLDDHTRRDIVTSLRELTAGGMAVVLIADTLDQLLATSDSVIVMRHGRISARYSMAEDRPAPQAILEMMS